MNAQCENVLASLICRVLEDGTLGLSTFRWLPFRRNLYTLLRIRRPGHRKCLQCGVAACGPWDAPVADAAEVQIRGNTSEESGPPPCIAPLVAARVRAAVAQPPPRQLPACSMILREDRNSIARRGGQYPRTIDCLHSQAGGGLSVEEGRGWEGEREGRDWACVLRGAHGQIGSEPKQRDLVNLSSNVRSVLLGGFRPSGALKKPIVVQQVYDFAQTRVGLPSSSLGFIVGLGRQSRPPE